MTSTSTRWPDGPVGESPGAGPPARDAGGRTAFRALLVTATLVLVAWGALSVASLLGRETERSSAAYPGVHTVDLDLGFESVTVVGDDSADSVAMDRSVTWSMREPQVGARVVGDRLLMTSSCTWDPGLGCSGSVRLVVPPDTALRVTGGDGHVTVRGLTGAVDLRTGDGGIDVSDVTGPVRLHAGDGSVDGTDLRSSDVSATTSDGSVRLAFAEPPDDVRARTGDGSVEILVPRDGQPWDVDATTSDGGRTVSVATDPAATRRLSAHTGDGSVLVAYSD